MKEIFTGRPGTDRSPVSKALKLLAHLAATKDAVALADLSRALKLPKPTIYRLARSIEAMGFVHKDPLTRRYRVGAAFEDLALTALRYGAGHAPRLLRMNELAERLGVRVNLVVLKAGSISNVEWVESTAPLRVNLQSDTPMAIHAGASGKLLLAFGSTDLQDYILRSAPFEAFTKNTITSRRVLARQLDEIRRRGYAEDDEEMLPGVNCLAVPIRNRANEVVAGLSVMAPAASLPLEKIHGHLRSIHDCAASISAELGWHPAAASTRSVLPSNQPRTKARARDLNSKSGRAARKRYRGRPARAAVNGHRPET